MKEVLRKDLPWRLRKDTTSVTVEGEKPPTPTSDVLETVEHSHPVRFPSPSPFLGRFRFLLLHSHTPLPTHSLAYFLTSFLGTTTTPSSPRHTDGHQWAGWSTSVPRTRPWTWR